MAPASSTRRIWSLAAGFATYGASWHIVGERLLAINEPWGKLTVSTPTNASKWTLLSSHRSSAGAFYAAMDNAILTTCRARLQCSSNATTELQCFRICSTSTFPEEFCRDESQPEVGCDARTSGIELLSDATSGISSTSVASVATTRTANTSTGIPRVTNRRPENVGIDAIESGAF